MCHKANPAAIFGIEVTAGAKLLLIPASLKPAAVHLSWMDAQLESHSRRFFHEFPNHRSEQAGFFARPGGPFELGAVAGPAGARSAAADAASQRLLRRELPQVLCLALRAALVQSVE